MTGEEAELPWAEGETLRARIYETIVAGSEARKKGAAIEANPHPPGTYFWSLWRDGYRDDLM